MKFSGQQPSDGGVHAGRSWFQHIWRVEQSAFREILSEDVEESDLPKGLTGQSKDMGPTGRHVASLNRNVIEHVRSTSFADGVSCTTFDWQQRSHRAVKRRQDRGSHGRPQSPRKSPLEQDEDSRKATPRIKKATKPRIQRQGRQPRKTPRPARRRKDGEARERPSHMRPVSLRENPL